MGLKKVGDVASGRCHLWLIILRLTLGFVILLGSWLILRSISHHEEEGWQVHAPKDLVQGPSGGFYDLPCGTEEAMGALIVAR